MGMKVMKNNQSKIKEAQKICGRAEQCESAGDLLAAGEKFSQAALLLVGVLPDVEIFQVVDNVKRCFGAVNEINRLAMFHEALSQAFSHPKYKSSQFEEAARFYSQMEDWPKTIECAISSTLVILSIRDEDANADVKRGRVIKNLRHLIKAYDHLGELDKSEQYRAEIEEMGGSVEPRKKLSPDQIEAGRQMFRLLQMRAAHKAQRDWLTAGGYSERIAELRKTPSGIADALAEASKFYMLGGNTAMANALADKAMTFAEGNPALKDRIVQTQMKSFSKRPKKGMHRRTAGFIRLPVSPRAVKKIVAFGQRFGL